MQDVIFSGTENRKPLSFASVAITMDNADHKLPVAYEEVTVTRRLYRSGESEYQLNGTTCRLKDIQEMFYDTGIGKEGYSIIGQGQIDRILSTRPEEARELFDEATGIVKFKKRKKTAEKKLDDEKQNLLRVNDILTELEKQVGPLERQAEKAKEYLKKKETLKEFEIHIFLMEMENIKKQLKELEETRKITQDQLDETKASFENTKLEYERIEKELEEIEQKIDAAKEEATSARVEKQQMKGQAGSSQRTGTFCTGKCKALCRTSAEYRAGSDREATGKRDCSGRKAGAGSCTGAGRKSADGCRAESIRYSAADRRQPDQYGKQQE